MKPKVVQHYDNPSNPDRCFVRLFKLYQSVLPKDTPKMHSTSILCHNLKMGAGSQRDQLVTIYSRALLQDYVMKLEFQDFEVIIHFVQQQRLGCTRQTSMNSSSWKELAIVA